MCNSVKSQHLQSPVFGLELGVGVSSLSYDNPMADWDEAGRVSFSGMAFVLLPIAKPFYLQTGLRMFNVGNDVGSEVIDEGQPLDLNFQITQNYLSIPLRLQVALGEKGLYVMAGGDVAYLMSANISQRIELSLDEQEASITSTLKRFNATVTGGVGYLMTLSTGQLYLQAHISRGVTGVAGTDGDFAWFSDWVTQEVLFTAGLIF